ncbi:MULTISPECIES: hypothetical protein [unclassified Beijerinckia]|uniref:hypothetical protein n=1 Tax=unclassified Beijerinckia TaxID=2638183 RepID=UPI00089827D5|nr:MULTISPECIES: hypothetical protein [unclassified Beijerinckia]MDH7794607.1 uncharacterized Zn finger protein (UPF0148 family) [Beijerinckia sp. GAS462]SEB68316.1 hypothetical protein SAMN05443249_0879 [Beijerinckia sp. 28-YEA-48]
MLQIREILLRGINLPDASVRLKGGANIIAGDSDTGKSYLLHLLNYILAADELEKRIPEAESYSQLFVQFENASNAVLTLQRSLSGGDVAVHHCTIAEIEEMGEAVTSSRSGKNTAPDVTSVLFEFASIMEARLRKNDDGKTQRLTIRTFIPITLVDEVSVIEEQSPVLGKRGFDTTARKRMFAYMLSGKDDSGIIAAEKREIATARMNAQVSLINDLLTPLEKRLQNRPAPENDETIERVEAAIERLTDQIGEVESERIDLQELREAAAERRIKAETQVIAIDELLTRYHLLSDRYKSDLERLDFIAEGAHYFEGLQEIMCPMCGQQMSDEHLHAAAQSSADVYSASQAEASKILAQYSDLEDAIASLERRREAREKDWVEAKASEEDANQRLTTIVQPALTNASAQLRRLTARRIELESTRNDIEQADALRVMKGQIEQNAGGKSSKKQWEELPGKSLRSLCDEIEIVLKAWQFKGACKVEFDPKKYDIIVDGQARQSHGKGVRAVLYSAFVIALLRYCHRENLPHPGFVVIDSPLTSYKKKQSSRVRGADGAIDAGVETAFWDSLKKIPAVVQVAIIENKEPPRDVADAVNYEWFAGDEAEPGERIGFIPPAPTND